MSLLRRLSHLTINNNLSGSAFSHFRPRYWSSVHIGDQLVYNTIKDVATRLNSLAIPYCIVGGNAVKAHGCYRATADVDILVTEKGRKEFIASCLGRGYIRRFENAPASFRHATNRIPVDIIISGDYPGDGTKGDFCFPDPGNDDCIYNVNYDGVSVNFIDLHHLLCMKLVSYHKVGEDRYRDKMDVIELIKYCALEKEYCDKVPISVKELYGECWEKAKQTEHTHSGEF